MKRLIKINALVLGLLFFCVPLAFSQSIKAAEKQDPQYIEVLKGRADKIVNTIDIGNPDKQNEVRDIIVMQYYCLSKIHDEQEASLKAVKEQYKDDGNAADKKIAKIDEKADKQLARLHKKYLKQLSARLTPEQLEGVKNGMTYDVVPNTYQAYQEMLPDLTEEQKKVILGYLIDAREHAMDAGSSEKKHWWFGQYKGKINNYLSAEGYNLNQAQKDWKKRREANTNKD